jgi:hypothetical protein
MQRRENARVRSELSQRKRHSRVCSACLCALALCFLLGACHGSDDPTQIQDSLDSWSRSVELAVQQWHEQRVPDLYLEQLLDAATNEKKKDEQQIGKLNGASAQSFVPQTHRLETKITDARSELARARQRPP